MVYIYKSFLMAEELEINSSKMSLDKKNEVITLEGNVEAKDEKNNTLFSESAKYDKLNDLINTFGKTKIITSEGYEIIGKNISYDGKNKIISSKDQTIIIDKEGNKIFVEMFNYFTNKNMFFSKGNINIQDIKNNKYYFSEIYIDEKKEKIVGSDVKAFLDQEDIKINKNNEPRFFANTMVLTKEKSEISKGVFTYCKDRGEEKCPPWILQSKKIEHDVAEKTIYYKDATLKIYDFPIFYFPIFSHPDPTVERRSGVLMPSFTDSKNLGSGISIPYYWAIAKDRDLTITPKLYYSENPLLLAEYRRDFRNSFLIIDAGHTPGYKNTSVKKSGGSKSHFFSRFNMNFEGENNASGQLEVKLQKVTNDTYLKVYDIDTALADKDINVLENAINYDYQSEDLFFGATVSAFDDLTKEDRSKYEYLLPYLTFEKNLAVNEKYGIFDLTSNFRVRNYDVNKQTEFFVNDINWESNNWILGNVLNNQFKSKVKTVNYNAKNTSEYKTDELSSEVSGVIGYLAKLGLYKNDFSKRSNYLLTPKLLVRYAPGHMRDVDKDVFLSYSNLFDINKINEIDVIENGFSTSLGVEYKKNELNKDGTLGKENFSFAIGQVVSERENQDIPSSSSLDQRFSDVVGETNFYIGENTTFDYKFSIDQNYQEINYNEVDGNYTLGNTKFNIGYLEKRNHIGKEEHLKTGFDITFDDSSKFSFATKRNLITDSAEFYNLSYEYLNDCLKAGIVFRREFYTDRDIEPDNSIMFTISILPFGDVGSPKLSK